MENKNRTTSVFASITNALEKVAQSLFAPVDIEKLAIIQLHSLTTQMF